MPHFVIDLSENILSSHSPETLIDIVHSTAEKSGLFAQGNIKVRLTPYSMFTCGGSQNDFLHVFGHIMGGRSEEQKKRLSDTIIKALKDLLPDVPVLSMNVYEFDPSTYSNRAQM